MIAMTIAQTGAEGVITALADGMKAASYARQLDASEAACRLLSAKVDALENDLAQKEAEIERLRKENRYYRFSRSRAYAQALEAQASSVAHRSERGWAALVVGAVGTVVGLAIAFTIVWCVGI